jgi:hypothetical protein
MFAYYHFLLTPAREDEDAFVVDLATSRENSNVGEPAVVNAVVKLTANLSTGV